MAVFNYQVCDQTGQNRNGQMEAEDLETAAASLRRQNLWILDIIPVKISMTANLLKMTGRSVNVKDLAFFCRQLATLLNSGIPMLAALEILQRQSEKPAFQEALATVVKGLKNGRPLADTLRQNPQVFPKLLVCMVEMGVEGGVIEGVLTRLTAHYEREQEVGEKIKSAAVYPLIVLATACCAVIFILVVILPNFIGLFAEAGLTLPLPTRIVVSVSSILGRFWWLVMVMISAIVWWFRQGLKNKRCKILWDRLLWKMPIAGNVVQKMLVASFSRSLADLMNCGIPILEALETVGKTISNACLAQGIREVQKRIILGQGIAGPMAEMGLLPTMAVQMIAIGEESSNLPELLEKVSLFYEREVDYLLGRLSTLLEPLLLIGVGAIVGFMVIAMLMPMFSMMTGAQF